MEIYPSLMIVHISSDKNVIEHQEQKVQNIETLAGMLSVSVGILSDINKYQAEPKGSYYAIDSNLDVSAYCLLTYVPETDVNNRSKNVIPDSKKGIWLKSDIDYFYNLYIFNDKNFTDGIISMCEMFHVDPKDFVFKLPFDSHQTYMVPEFYSEPYIKTYDAEDLDDIAEEEDGNENILEPLKKDY